MNKLVLTLNILFVIFLQLTMFVCEVKREKEKAKNRERNAHDWLNIE